MPSNKKGSSINLNTLLYITFLNCTYLKIANQGDYVVIKDVMQGLAQEMTRELLTGYSMGLVLTYAGGELGRSYKDPEKDPVPFTVGVGVPSIGGATLYKILEGPAMFYPKSYEPVGALGYVLGSMTGMVLLGARSVIREYSNGSNTLNTLKEKVDRISLFCKEKVDSFKNYFSDGQKIDELEQTLYSL